jgi:DNA adenine methylase
MATQAPAAFSDAALPPLKPPLKWAGGKRWLVPLLREFYAPYRDRRLVEPLAGGLAVALGLRPERALLNDLNPHNINFYRWLQQGLELEIPMANDSEMYYLHRRRFNQLIARGGPDSREAAQLFYYLNRTGYNGLCRFNRSGEFNVPFGRHSAIGYVSDFSAYRDLLNGWRFTARDVEAVPLEPGDFVYADPPYDVVFRSYAREGFSWEDQERAAAWLARHRGPVVLVNQATDRVETLFRKLGYSVGFLDGPRRISRTGDRTPAREIMGTRNL